MNKSALLLLLLIGLFVLAETTDAMYIWGRRTWGVNRRRRRRWNQQKEAEDIEESDEQVMSLLE
uniref:Uncharacterized protein n=1 Tax=Ciona intestinalis TaxID=7719 RepID=F6ZZA5_CIOIN